MAIGHWNVAFEVFRETRVMLALHPDCRANLQEKYLRLALELKAGCLFRQNVCGSQRPRARCCSENNLSECQLIVGAVYCLFMKKFYL